jgi:hypothetical protein
VWVRAKCGGTTSASRAALRRRGVFHCRHNGFARAAVRCCSLMPLCIGTFDNGPQNSAALSSTTSESPRYIGSHEYRPSYTRTLNVLPEQCGPFNTHSPSRSGSDLVQSIFSPPSRRCFFGLRLNILPPRRRPKNALQNVFEHISCGNTARGDLCGGYRVTDIPTAT